MRKGDGTIKINKSAARAIDVLKLLAKSDKSLTLTEIGRAMDMPMSSAFELIYTLIQREVVEIDNEDLRTFKLGIKVFEIGSSVAGKLYPNKIARPVLENLSLVTGETVFYAVENNSTIVYLDRVEENSSITTATGLGARNPMHTTGIGKALLANYSNEQIARIVGDGVLATKTEFSVGTYPALIADLEQVRKRGYSIDNRENEPEIFCVAAPIYDRTGASVAGISIASIYTRMTEDRVQYLGECVTKAALAVSKKLGFIGEKLYFNFNEQNEK